MNMAVEMGEYVVGAYLEFIKKCEVVHYGARLPGGGLGGLNELDVVGLNFAGKTAYLCEVTTHLNGLAIINYPTTVEKFKKKYSAAKKYADVCLKDLKDFQRVFMFWSPRVSEGRLTEQLRAIGGWELVINRSYSDCVEQLRREAERSTRPTSNPFFRALQIIGHLKH
ncbi:MAG: hypothetical protein ABSA97_01870 [Verrucomicrobiia bacterium]